jgi:two-component sensor histidine kinase
MPIDDALRLQAENLDLRRLLQQAGVDAAEQKTLEQLQTLLVAELHHRIQNMLAMVGAIVSQSLRTAETIEEGRQGVESRIAALSRVHVLLLHANWRSSRLREILRTAIEPFDGPGRGRFHLQVPDVEAAASAALPLSMAINELCTNATKYGALSVPTGSVEITAIVDEPAGQFCLKWKEAGGPTVREPKRRGFGTRLIQQSFVSQLNGAVRLLFEPSGVVCEIDVPLVALTPPPSN